jgi:hypothetical protein
MTNTEKTRKTNAPPPALVSDDASADGSTMYKYRDFSNVPEEELEQDPAPASTPPPSSRGNAESSIRVQKFPVKLYAILAQKEFHDIITWMPHGRSWKVLKPNLFESLVMPLFFEYSNYHSFNRLVNAWSFRRISTGPDRGSYYHEVRPIGDIEKVVHSERQILTVLPRFLEQLFLRGKPQLQKYMRRLPKTHKKLPMKKEDEPDFYTLDEETPLPPLEEVPLPSGSVMTPMRQQQGLNGGLGMQQIIASPNGLSSFKDSLESRDPLLGLSQSRQTNMAMNSMGAMNGMGGMNGMSNMNGMGGMGGIGSLGGMNNLGAMGGFGGMNSMNGINSLRDAQFQQGMGDFGGAFGAQPSQLDQFQRLRQFQQMQLLERQMGSGTIAGLSNDPFARMQAENAMGLRLSRQPC